MVSTPLGPLPWFLTYLPVFGLGLIVGSFVNVLIYRLPRGESIAFPGSHCPHCSRPIRPWENIPVFSWLALGGRCKGCRERISIRYPLVELMSACLALLAVIIYGFTYAGFAFSALFIALLALIIIDLEHWLLPFAFTIPLTIIGVIGAWWFDMRPLADSLLGMGVGFAVFMVMLFGGKAIFKRDAMGGGDVVFGMMAGAFLGWKLTLLMIFVASFLGTLISIPLLILGKSVSGRSIPFGPFLAVGMVICLFLGDPIINWYIGLLH
jgi:leader peptidase (prepilin peptidase)/N-methyltransferase